MKILKLNRNVMKVLKGREKEKDGVEDTLCWKEETCTNIK